jgi:hypothetical protein
MVRSITHHLLLAKQAAWQPHSLVEEGRELAGVHSVRLRPPLAQLGGFRIES